MGIELICELKRDNSVVEKQELVRCKDCLHRYGEQCGMRCEFDNKVFDWTEDDGFCSHGETYKKRTGVWVDYMCSVCGHMSVKEFPYCPYCGAEMWIKEEKNETD